MTETYFYVTIAVLFTFLLSPYLIMLYDKMFHTHYLCNTFGWHNGDDASDQCVFDGASFHAKCSKCGKEVMQDSQGNWF